MISVIGTPRIQSNIERIMVSFMSYKKIIRLWPYELLTSPLNVTCSRKTPAGYLKKPHKAYPRQASESLAGAPPG
jgi:hypothetical protein